MKKMVRTLKVIPVLLITLLICMLFYPVAITLGSVRGVAAEVHQRFAYLWNCSYLDISDYVSSGVFGNRLKNA